MPWRTWDVCQFVVITALPLPYAICSQTFSTHQTKPCIEIFVRRSERCLFVRVKTFSREINIFKNFDIHFNGAPSFLNNGNRWSKLMFSSFIRIEYLVR